MELYLFPFNDLLNYFLGFFLRPCIMPKERSENPITWVFLSNTQKNMWHRDPEQTESDFSNNFIAGSELAVTCYMYP